MVQSCRRWEWERFLRRLLANFVYLLLCPEDKPSAAAHGSVQTLSSRRNGVKTPKGPVLHPLQRGTAAQARGMLAGEASGRPGLRQWEGVSELAQMHGIQACKGSLAVCLYPSLS